MPRGRGVNASGGCRHMTYPAVWPEQSKQKEKCKAAKEQSSLRDVSPQSQFPAGCTVEMVGTHKLATHCAVQAPGGAGERRPLCRIVAESLCALKAALQRRCGGHHDTQMHRDVSHVAVSNSKVSSLSRSASAEEERVHWTS